MSDTSANLFSYCVGGLALLSTIISIVLFYRSYLPSVQMKLLDELLDETKAIFHKVDTDGMLPTEASRRFIATTLAAFEEACSSLREDTYRAMTPLDEYFGLLRGNSKRIARLAYEVKKLRSFLQTTDQSVRRAKEAQRLAALAASTQNMEHNNNDTTPPQSADGYQQHSQTASSTLLGPGLLTTVRAGPQFNLDPESVTFSFPFEEPRQPSQCCLCSFMHWWKAEPSGEGLRTIPSLQSPVEELSSPHLDALSRSSTLVDHPPSSKRRWLFGALWSRRARSVRKEVTTKPDLTNNHQGIFGGWMSRSISTSSDNTEANTNLDDTSLPV